MDHLINFLILAAVILAALVANSYLGVSDILQSAPSSN